MVVLRKTVQSVPDTIKNIPLALDSREAAGVLALAFVVPLAATRLALNAPVSVPLTATGSWQALVEATALVGPAVAAIVFGLTDDDPAAQVALVSIGTFGLLAVPFEAASVPAYGAVVAGTWLVALLGLRDRLGFGAVQWAKALIVGALLLGLTLSLLGSAGFAPARFRPVGSLLTLVGVASVPALVDATYIEWALYGLIAAIVLSVGVTAPFVTGAIVLVVGGAIGVPLLLVALATGGAASTVAVGLRSDLRVAAAGGLLLAAGVPATLTRAFATTVAIVLLLDGIPTGARGGEVT